MLLKHGDIPRMKYLVLLTSRLARQDSPRGFPATSRRNIRGSTYLMFLARDLFPIPSSGLHLSSLLRLWDACDRTSAPRLEVSIEKLRHIALPMDDVTCGFQSWYEIV